MLPDLPRIGIRLAVTKGHEEVRWFGRGPHESYCDRKAGVPIGLYSGTVADQYVPYIVPQEHGNKTDVRWLEVRHATGRGVLFVADDVLEVGVSHFTPEDLFDALHAIELNPRPETYVYLDRMQRGLGGASCGPDTLEKYLVHSGMTYRFGYRMRPYRQGEIPAQLARQPMQ